MLYIDNSTYNILVSFYDLLTSILVVFVIRYLIQAEKEKQTLRAEKNRLLTHDPVTDLLNNPEYLSRINPLIASSQSFMHLLIDCENFKEMDDAPGEIESNEILKYLADFLKSSFPDAIALARYGRDEFAAALHVNPDTNSIISRTLDKLLPHALRLKVTYSHAVYPLEAMNKQELFSLAERADYFKPNGKNG